MKIKSPPHNKQSTKILENQLQSEDIGPLLVETSAQPKIMKVNLWLGLENNNKFVRENSVDMTALNDQEKC